MRRCRSRLVTAAACVVALGAIPATASAHGGHGGHGGHGFGGYPGTSDLTRGWAIQSSVAAPDPGSAVSDPSYSTNGWAPLSRPETLMAGLVENHRYPNIFYSDNLAAVDPSQFEPNWWYREQVRLHPRPGQHTFLIMHGVASRANLWINGTKVADQSELQGSYSRFEYDVTPYVRDGENAIALDVFRNASHDDDVPGQQGYLTLDMNDWNQPSPDDYTGLQFAPQLAQDGPVSLRGAHVVQDNAPDMSASDLTVKADVRNNTDQPQETVVAGTITRHGTHIAFSRRVSLAAGETRTVAFSPSDTRGLHLRRPAVWWPRQMGGQPLYHLSMAAFAGHAQSDRSGLDFGIRTVTSRLTPVVPGKTHGSQGYRQFLINGVPFVVRGGGWSQDMFLRYSPRYVHDALDYIADMGLNAIRFEGNFPPEDMLDQMDRQGILAMPGWECCNKWEDPSDTWSDEIKANAANQARAVAEEMRDHPSVYTFFQGSDEAPDPAKESIYLDAFRAADWQVPMVASAEYKASPQLGMSGTKEGPYNYAPPIYWWDATKADDSPDNDFTNQGGSFGYDTEAGAGNTVPTQDSLDRFMTKEDQQKVWDPNTVGTKDSGESVFHTSPRSRYTEIDRFGQYNTPLWNRYGPWSDEASYQREAQAGGYEVTRSIFESYLGHAKDPANPSTGFIYWMMNKAWPSLQWELFGYDFDQPGVYFGAKKSGEPVHVMYSYDDGSIKVDNLTNEPQRGLQVRADWIGIDGKVAQTASASVPALSSQDVRTVISKSAPSGISTTYFLRLALTRGHDVVSRNVYWLSTKPDTLDWGRTLGRGYGAVFAANGYADLTGLQSLGTAAVRVSASSQGARGGQEVTSVRITNVSDHPVPAFLARADVRRGTRSGDELGGDDEVRPIRWSDNDVTLWPGESQTLVARYRRSDLRGAQPVVSVAGWNVDRQVVAAGDGHGWGDHGHGHR